MSKQHKKRRTKKVLKTQQHIEEAVACQKQHQQSETRRERYSDDDFVSKMLIKWPFHELLETSKLLLILINRRLSPTAVPTTIPPPLHALLCYKYPCEYVETLFGEQTMILCDDVYVSFRHYYNMVYREAKKAASGDALSPEHKTHLVLLLRACFLIALVYDARVRRFVFAKHDIHYMHLETHPPSVPKTREFIGHIRTSIDAFLGETMPIDTMVECAITMWCEKYMFRLI